MTNQTKPPVRRLDGASMTGSPRAPQQRPQRQPEPEFSARPLEEYADEAHEDYDAEPPAPAPAAPPRRPPAPPAPAVGDGDDENVVVFSRAYQAHGDAISRIRLRRPVTKEIRQIGNPLVFDTNERGGMVIKEINLDRIARYVVVLSDPPLPPSTVDQLDYFDLDACAAVIGPFFVRFT